MALGDIDSQFLIRPLGFEIRSQLLPQQARMTAHDAVFTGVVTCRSSEDLHPDLLLGRVLGRIADGTLRHIEQEVTQTGRTLEVPTGRYPQYQGPAGILE